MLMYNLFHSKVYDSIQTINRAREEKTIKTATTTTKHSNQANCISIEIN